MIFPYGLSISPYTLFGSGKVRRFASAEESITKSTASNQKINFKILIALSLK